MRSSLRRLIPVLLLGAVSMLFTLLLVEGMLWTVAPLAGRGDELRFPVRQQIPGVRPEATYERNGFGFRSLSMRSEPKPPRTLRVVVLGGSTTDEATHDTADTWSGQLERSLRDAFAPQKIAVEVLAYGRPGHTIVESLAFARLHLARFEPDLIITLDGINQLAWRGGPDYRYDGSSIAPEAGRARWLARLEDSCLAASQLCRRTRVAKNRLQIWWALQRGRALGWQAEELPTRRAEYAALPFVAEPRRNPDPIREFGDAVDALLTWVVSQQLDAVVLGQPVLWRPVPSDAERAVFWFPIQTPAGSVRADPGWMEREMRRYNGRQAEVARRHGFTFIDLDPILPKDLEHFIDDCHFTNRGSRLVAESITGAVRERLLARAEQRGLIDGNRDPRENSRPASVNE